MEAIYVVCGLYLTVFFLGQIVPLFQARSRGISLSWLEYCSPMIKKSIFSSHYNPSVFDAMIMIRENKLDISFFELEHMYQCNIDFRNVIDAMLLARRKGVTASKSVLRDLAERKKDLIEIINSKKPGEEVFFEEAFAVKIKWPYNVI